MSVAILEHFLFVEQLRATVVDALRRYAQSRLSIAEEAGVGPRVVSRLLAGDDGLSPKHLRALNAWADACNPIGTWAEHAALAALVAAFPVDRRLGERAALTDWIADRLMTVGEPAPDWLRDELDDIRYLMRRRPTRDVETLDHESADHA